MTNKFNEKKYKESRELINKRLKILRTKKSRIDDQINELVFVREFIKVNYKIIKKMKNDEI